MLINEITGYCDDQYSSINTKIKCDDCTKTKGCTSCKDCLTEIHYNIPGGKNDYDCKNLINFYVCDYSFKYASEILYLLRQSQKIKEISTYHITSIGCGACPDLMAFESYVNETDPSKAISYLGIDINELWKPIHNKIKEYDSKIIYKTRFRYDDAFKYLDQMIIKDANVLILQYIISHFYNTGKIGQLDTFFDELIHGIVKHKNNDMPFIVIINDVNSNNRGRDYFLELRTKLKEADFHGCATQYYFDYNLKSEHQRYGICHKSNDILYEIPFGFDKYEPWEHCSSAQLLLEIY